MPFQIIIVVGSAVVALIIGSGFWLQHRAIKKALSTQVIPKLKSGGLQFVRWERCGLLDVGAFINDAPDLMVVINHNGRSKTRVHINLYYYDTVSGLSKRVTIRIDMFRYKVTKITYSRPL